MAADVQGREHELERVRAFVAALDEGPAALVLEGEAGAGKSTLWAAAIRAAEARGHRVLRARPSEAETSLSFASVRDLLEPVAEEALAALPPVQQRALARALLRGDDVGAPPEPHAIGVALLGALRALAVEASLVIAVDDAQWLDPPSDGALVYAIRRLDLEPVGVLLVRRTPLPSALVTEARRSPAAARLVDVPVGPLPLAALHRAVEEQLGVVLPRPVLADVHRAAGGNPFYALELVRMLQREGAPIEAGRPLPLPDSLKALVESRLAALPRASRDFLLGVAAAAQPTIALVEAATGIDRSDGLRPAHDAGVVELDGGLVRFTHPLLAAGISETADPLRRADVHAALAGLVDDPEARGVHLAASTTEPDEAVARALDDAARHARARGAPHAAALLLERACALTPAEQPDDAARRSIEAAYLHYESGDSARARGQLESLVASLPAGPRRAWALVRLARVRSYDAQHEAVELFHLAIEEADGEPAVLAVAHEGVAACLYRLRERLADAVEHAEAARRLALATGDSALAAEALGSRLLAETALGREEARATCEEALARQDAAAEHRILGQPLVAAAVHWWWTGALDRAYETLDDLLRRCDELGDHSSLPYVLVLLGQVEWASGRFDAALARAREGREGAAQAGQETVVGYHLALEGLAAAALGEVEVAREAAGRALELSARTGGRPTEIVARSALGHLELSLGRPDAAVAVLAPVVAHVRAEEIAEPGAVTCMIDAVEALVEVGRGDDAQELLRWVRAHAERLGRITTLASCARAAGLLASADGRVDEAIARLQRALALHDEVPRPFDRARTLLALGAAQRRAKRRRVARATLEEARTAFAVLGADLWAATADEELRRISGRAPSEGSLTPAEAKVAALVAEGRTNREVAAALYLSERTVEGHLSRVFAKLGVRRRGEVAAALAPGQEQGAGPSITGETPVSPDSRAS